MREMSTLCVLLLLSYFVLKVSAVTSQTKDTIIIWGSKECANNSIRRFKIEWAEEAICDLRYRIKNTRATYALEGVRFTYGFDTGYLTRWMDYWANEYDFAKRVQHINKYPQYKTCIEGLDIHFLWVKPRVNTKTCKILPLLLMHGFPDSVMKFYKTIPMLISCVNGIALEVIAPSLPGFGYSDGATKAGFGPGAVATVLVKLMTRLGHTYFYVQSGDSMNIGSAVATIYPEKILGFHTNYAVSYNPLSWAMWIAGAIYPTLVIDHPVVEDRMYPVYEILKNIFTETGFLHMFITKPNTIALALGDSPAGLCAFILNVYLWGTKRHYTHIPDGGLSYLNMDDELDNCGHYWFPGPDAITKPSRMFLESFNEIMDKKGHYSIPTEVLTWTTHAKNDIFCQSSAQLKIKFPNLMTAEVLEDGGHFLANEKPEYFADSVHSAISAFNKIHESRLKFTSKI